MKDTTKLPARDLLLVFGTVQRVMRAESLAREGRLDVDVIPAPRAVSSECGMVLEAHANDAPRLAALLAGAGIELQAVYRRGAEAWVLGSLDSAGVPGAALAASSAYGGCGAKLSKGLLDTILCGLPRLESEALIVGIESADDAGIVRLDPETGLIHTVDFFPPMVDDPYSFGRIAAANALSDVYAMGGRPLAALNIVSFPLEEHGREVLKEILRGGLAALGEACALLAGGHTIEGQELLYGMAVTGLVHPDRIWHNGGARPGDALVLTKPLGSGLVTTAAKAGLAKPADLTTAIRWMATLNGAAAEAAADAQPDAVTDVTGFGLAGHAAEMAAASSLEISLELAALPVLPGALEAASTGLVPAGAAKNRRSLDTTLELAPGADPLRVDLALDPQTSGGLLIACSHQRAQALVRRLPGAAVVGGCQQGEAGLIRLG